VRGQIGIIQNNRSEPQQQVNSLPKLCSLSAECCCGGFDSDVLLENCSIEEEPTGKQWPKTPSTRKLCVREPGFVSEGCPGELAHVFEGRLDEPGVTAERSPIESDVAREGHPVKPCLVLEGCFREPDVALERYVSESSFILKGCPVEVDAILKSRPVEPCLAVKGRSGESGFVLKCCLGERSVALERHVRKVSVAFKDYSVKCNFALKGCFGEFSIALKDCPIKLDCIEYLPAIFLRDGVKDPFEYPSIEYRAPCVDCPLVPDAG
jgi:hypothetical protein